MPRPRVAAQLPALTPPRGPVWTRECGVCTARPVAVAMRDTHAAAQHGSIPIRLKHTRHIASTLTAQHGAQLLGTAFGTKSAEELPNGAGSEWLPGKAAEIFGRAWDVRLGPIRASTPNGIGP
eukprot:353270-Chlamydomonas_euryale.AAC.1